MESPSQTPNAEIGRRQLVLLMLGVAPDGGISDGLGGITRLQKYLFLLEQEAGVRLSGDAAFAFKAYKAGPYSRKIYDDLELLENFGLIRSETIGSATPAEHATIEDLTFGHLLGSDATALSSESAELAETADTFSERRFTLTDKGRKVVENILVQGDAVAPFVEGIRKVKSRFSSHSLQDLLYYVYTKYEDGGWTDESEIKEQVLSKGTRRK